MMSQLFCRLSKMSGDDGRTTGHSTAQDQDSRKRPAQPGQTAPDLGGDRTVRPAEKLCDELLWQAVDQVQADRLLIVGRKPGQSPLQISPKQRPIVRLTRFLRRCRRAWRVMGVVQ